MSLTSIQMKSAKEMRDKIIDVMRDTKYLIARYSGKIWITSTTELNKTQPTSCYLKDCKEIIPVIITLKIPKGTMVSMPKYTKEEAFSVLCTLKDELDMQSRGASRGEFVTVWFPKYGYLFSTIRDEFDSLFKCRAERAKVLRIDGLCVGSLSAPITEASSSYHKTFKYTIGETVSVEDFDRSKEICSTGIHFFMDREDAVNYEW